MNIKRTYNPAKCNEIPPAEHRTSHSRSNRKPEPFVSQFETAMRVPLSTTNIIALIPLIRPSPTAQMWKSILRAVIHT